MRELLRNLFWFWENFLCNKKWGDVDEDFAKILETNYFVHRKNRLIKLLSKEDRLGFYDVIRCLKKNIPFGMAYDVESCRKIMDQIDDNTDIAYDSQKGMFFVIHKGKRLYYSKLFDTKRKVRESYLYLMYEQSEESPHKYIDKDFDVEEGTILVDCGAAEALFALDNIEKLSKCYIIECDDEWIEALHATFDCYGDKVKIIKTFLADNDTDSSKRLDTILKGEKVSFIKMDLEGYEYKALQGAKSILENNFGVKFAIAVYHNSDDEKKISEMMEEYGYKVSVSSGYLMYEWELEKSVNLRHGIIRAKTDRL